LVDYKALWGDPSDNIPGVAGVGEKTAGKLIREFRSVKNLYQEIEKGEGRKIPPKLKDLLLCSREQVSFCRRLAEIKKDVPLDFHFDEQSWRVYNKEKAAQILRGFEFHSLIERLPQDKIEKSSKNGKIKKEKANQQLLFF